MSDNAPSTSPIPTPINVNAEDTIDRFATLFAPATPPASPASPLDCSGTPRPPPSFQVPVYPRQHSSPASSDADVAFSPFVSVPSSHDPLSLTPPLTPDVLRTTDSSGQTPVQTQTPAVHTHRQTSSLNFFDKFTEDAKRASEKNKRGVLDELLLHEDDPLYWLKDQAHDTGNGHGNKSPWPPIERRGGSPPGGVDPELDATPPLIDLEFDDLSIDSKENKPPSIIHDTPPTPPPRPSATPVYDSGKEYHHSPPSLLSPQPQPSSSTPIPSGSRSNTPPIGSLASQRSNHNSLTSLSSRFMSSLLSSSQPSPPMTTSTAHNPLDTLFSNTTPPSNSKSAKRRHPTAQSSLPSIGPNPYPHLHHTQTFSGISVYHGTPFGSHSYIPPSGAPGFAGDDHAWDKGFSKDYDREKTEKRSVLLKGRKEGEGYVHVLCTELADMIRPHLPALSRLPSTWTLLYSLDQHGISLNTLYAQCEPQRSKAGVGTTGALVVIKDSGDALFGVWMGEGIMLTKGAYYGSGESFLWRYIGGKLDVFKWTGRNDYVALCEPEYISFGGGDGNYGLYLDETLLDGSSARCPTFANEPLCSPGPKKVGAVMFECVGLEVWGIGS